MKETDERQPHWAKQREERGFDDTEMWALDTVFAKFALPRLKRFKETKICYPPSLTPKKWDNAIQAMIDGFEEYLRRDEHPSDWDTKKIDKGMKLFIKYFHDLWS